jgi:hypothetical protein
MFGTLLACVRPPFRLLRGPALAVLWCHESSRRLRSAKRSICAGEPVTRPVAGTNVAFLGPAPT